MLATQGADALADCFETKTELEDAITAAVAATDGNTGVGFDYTTDTKSYGPIEAWCFEATLNDFSLLFSGKTGFNADISGWDVSMVTSMYRMVSSLCQILATLAYFSPSSSKSD